MRQPLSYQTTANSCWLTSMLNGMLHLLGDAGSIPTLASHILHSMVTDAGADFDYKKYSESYDRVFECLETLAKLEISTETGSKSKRTLGSMCFAGKVAICDIHNGEHSILLTERKGDWYIGFDPLWEHVVTSHEWNLKIRQDYMFCGRKKDRRGRPLPFSNKSNKFKLGEENLSIAVIAKPE